jgi:hypothetical protein
MCRTLEGSRAKSLPSAPLLDTVSLMLLGGAPTVRSVIEHAPRLRTSGDAVDPDGRLRILEVAGRSWVVKLAPEREAHHEAGRARAVARALVERAHSPLRVIVPAVVPGVGTITPYIGPSLQRVEPWPQWLTSDAVQAIAQALLAAGVEWPGFLPRNLFPDENAHTLAAIDWETVRLDERGASDLTLLKWRVGWAASPIGATWVERLAPQRTAPLDDFERTLTPLLAPGAPASQVRQIANRVTLGSELVPLRGVRLSAADVGHAVDDLFGTPMAVVYAAAATADPTYIERIAIMLDGLLPSGPAAPALRRAVMGALLGVGGDHAEALGGGRGLNAATRRAAAAVEIVERSEMLLRNTCPVMKRLDVLLRGSAAQGLLSARSDVDFEVSGPEWPRGHAEAETVVAAALSAFGFECETSSGRPTERDLFNADGDRSRDLHEYMELRRPGASAHDPGWLAGDIQLPPGWPTRASAYERGGYPQDGKHAFFAARSLIARIAFGRLEPPVPATIAAQLDALAATRVPVDELRTLLQQSLAAYEERSPAERLHREIGRLRAVHQIGGTEPWDRRTTIRSTGENV